MAGPRAVAKWQGGFSSWLEDERGHRVRVDLTKEEGGDDSGTSALELNLLSLAGCITTIFALVARKRHVQFEGLYLELQAERPRGSPTFTAVQGKCVVTSENSAEDVETALRITERTCPVGVLYAQAGIPVKIAGEVARPVTKVA